MARVWAARSKRRALPLEPQTKVRAEAKIRLPGV